MKLFRSGVRLSRRRFAFWVSMGMFTLGETLRASSFDRWAAAALGVLTPLQNAESPEIAEALGVKHCVSCANGTDALALVLMAWGVKPGDAVFVPAFTFVSTAEVVAWLGATPVFTVQDLHAAVQPLAHIDTRSPQWPVCRCVRKHYSMNGVG